MLAARQQFIALMQNNALNNNALNNNAAAAANALLMVGHSTFKYRQNYSNKLQESVQLLFSNKPVTQFSPLWAA